MDSPNPEGLGFVLTDEEEIINYLKKKRLDPDFSVHAIPELDIYKLEPSELPGFSETKRVCYFFREPCYTNRKRDRERRKTNTGYWKITGNARDVRAGSSGEVIGFKKYVPFRSTNSASKKAKFKWVMRVFSVEHDPLYKKDFVICRIERKWNKKHCVSTSDEGKSSKQVVSPTQILPGDHSISNGKHIDENFVINPQLPPPNHNVISCPGNYIEQTCLSNHKPLPNHNMVSDPGNCIEQNTFSNTQLLPLHSVVPDPENHFVQNTLSNPQLLPPNLNLISYSGNLIEQNTNTQLVPFQNLTSYPRNQIEGNTLTSPQLSNYNMISFPWNHMENNTFTELQLPPNSVPQLVSKISLLEENHQLGEFNAGGGYNGLNYASFSSPQSPNYQEMEPSYSNGPIDNCDVLNFQNLTSYPRNQIEGNTLTSPQLSNYNMISFPWNHMEGNTFMESQLPPNSVPQLVSKISLQEENQLGEFNAGGGYNGPNYASFSTPQSPNYQEMELSYSNSPIENCDVLNFQNLTSYPRNQIEGNTLTSPQLSNYNMISFPWNHMEGNTFIESQLPPNSVPQLVSKISLQEENQLGEFNAGGGYNGLNYASFSTPQSPNYQEMELSYSTGPIENCDFFNFQFDSEQVNDLINLQRAFQDENSHEETGQTHTPEFNSSKSDGGTYAEEDSSDTNTETFNALLDELLLETIA